MALNQTRPLSDSSMHAYTTSIATTPVAAYVVSTCSGYVQRVTAAAAGTTTGTITVAVAINGGSDIANSGLTVAAGTGVRAGTTLELALVGAGSTSGVYVNEGDLISFTPSGGTGSSIPGAFAIVVRKLA